jgi:D-alanyl-D-alanine carboxypeptidase/D-alanyl-D-alanine-endopeptidase (penicillin-binding protein 4)
VKRILGVLLLCCGTGYAAAPAGFRADEVAIWAAPVEGDTVFDTWRADVPVNPASTMKLLTSWAALNRLGPNFRWKTEFKSDAPLENGVLRGDLYWVGRGDPRLDSPRLAEMLRQLRLRGVQRIEGRLLLDKHAYSNIGSAEGFGGDADRVFTVPPDTHLLNLKVAWLRYGFDAGKPIVQLDPPLPAMTLDNQLQAGGSASCGDVRQHVRVEASDSRIRVSGKLPPSCDGAASYVNVLDINSFAGQSFTALWRSLGGQGPASLGVANAPAGARTLLQQESDPLGAVLMDMNKFSNNTMARSVLLALGMQQPQSGDTLQDSVQQVRSLLQSKGLAADKLVLENGAGLSRRERVSTRLLGEVLRDAARGPYGPELAATLPLAGEDGTLRKRLGSFAGSLRMKTGTLDDTRALAGYWQAPTGQRLVIVAVVNSPRASELTPALDAAVGDVIRRYQASLLLAP